MYEPNRDHREPQLARGHGMEMSWERAANNVQSAAAQCNVGALAGKQFVQTAQYSGRGRVVHRTGSLSDTQVDDALEFSRRPQRLRRIAITDSIVARVARIVV